MVAGSRDSGSMQQEEAKDEEDAAMAAAAPVQTPRGSLLAGKDEDEEDEDVVSAHGAHGSVQDDSGSRSVHASTNGSDFHKFGSACSPPPLESSPGVTALAPSITTHPAEREEDVEDAVAARGSSAEKMASIQPVFLDLSSSQPEKTHLVAPLNSASSSRNPPATGSSSSPMAEATSERCRQ